MSADKKIEETAASDLSVLEDERYYHIAGLSRISEAISGLRDLNTILKVGLDNALEICKGTTAGIMLLDPETKTLSYHVYSNLSEKYIAEMRFSLGEGIAGKVALSGKPMMFDDISQVEDAVRQDLISIEGLKAFISVPLRAKRNVLGVLNIASRSPSKFSSADMFFLQSVGDQLGLAIEQAKLYDQLRSGRERYRKLSHLMILAQEDERRKIAGSLGDITSRSLSSIALNLQALVEMAQEIDINDEEFKSKLEKTHSMTVEVGNEVNRLIADLRPTFMDTLELVPAIRHYAETNLIPLGIDVAFDFNDGETSLPPDLATRLFRITQGVIGNIQQHSQATKVNISLKIINDELILHINDNGRGFDVRRLSHIEENGRGAGLFGMKEKTRLLGGRCSIESKDGQGTSITAIIPLQ